MRLGMDIPAIEETVKNCKEHIDKLSAKNPDIEMYLTHFLLVFICRTYEKEIKRIVIDRARKTKDEHMISFVDKTVQAYRCLKISDIKGNILAKFDERLADLFYKKIEKTDSEIMYTNIVLARDAVAHDRPVNVTFGELVASYKTSSQVLDALVETLQ
jgi:hypothetical protein